MVRLLQLAGAVVVGGCLVAGTVAAAPLVRPAAATVVRPAMVARPAPTAVTRAGKGVSAWVFNGVDKALAKSGASWYYTWAPDHSGITSPGGVRFVPMIWGAGSVTSATLHEVRHEGPDLLGFNEPDMASQSNMSVSQALGLWPRLMGTGLKLGSPAVATGAATPGGWLDRFMRGVRARHLRVNFITVHWYGGDFVTGQAVQQLRGYLEAIHARYRLPIWLTEFALIRFGSTTTFPSGRQQAAFLTAATSMLGRLSFVRRYAWFALPATSGDGTAGLFRPGAIATRAGRAFEAAGAATGLR